MVPGWTIETLTEKQYLIVAQQKPGKWVDVLEGNNHHDSTEVFGDLHAGNNVVLHATDDIKQGTAVQ
jgi:membrane fusion protein, multidrug efflux system